MKLRTGDLVTLAAYAAAPAFVPMVVMAAIGQDALCLRLENGSWRCDAYPVDTLIAVSVADAESYPNGALRIAGPEAPFNLIEAAGLTLGYKSESGISRTRPGQPAEERPGRGRQLPRQEQRPATAHDAEVED